MARQQAAKQARGLAHPQLCLDAVQAGIERGGHAGLQTEAECFVRAASLPVHKALVWTFLGQRATQRVKGITDGDLKARPQELQVSVIAC
jgi:enoyl-CoA hydratase/3-hydroxyacyl-CoA dehydrogenase